MAEIMNAKLSGRLSIAASVFALLGTLVAGEVITTFIPGRVISTSLHGHGSIQEKSRKPRDQKDIWWSYCISTLDKTYTVFSREDPNSAGLREKSSIRFIERQNQIYVKNPAGKWIALKIVRKGKDAKCP